MCIRPCLGDQVEIIFGMCSIQTFNSFNLSVHLKLPVFKPNSKKCQGSGCCKCSRTKRYQKLRADNFAQLKAGLSGIKGISILDTDHPNKVNSHYCLSVILHDDFKDYRDSIIAGLKKAGVGTSIYYPHPVQRLTYYKNKYDY